jgi:23S rRNA pseudoU1915 N3-methylase RlmH
MQATASRSLFATTLAIALLSGVSLVATRSAAQNPEVQQRLADIKAASAKNKQALAAYTWTEQDTISLKGEVKKQESYQVHNGPDGKPEKTPLNPQAASAPQQQADGGGRRGGRFKEKIVENKKEEFKEYAEKLVALVHSYVPPDPAKLQDAAKQGNVKMSPGSMANQVQLVITNYVKPNDSMTLIFDKEAKAIQAIQIASYLDSPDDAAKFEVEFAKLPDGVNHVSNMTLDGVSKQLKVAIQNSDYKKM